MPSLATALSPSANWRDRLLRNPIIRIILALLAIAIPFAIVALPFNLYVSDRILKKAGALLLAVVILAAYRTYVKVVERRPVTELCGTRAIRELCAGLLLGSLLLSVTIGGLAALGVYRTTGTNGWTAMLATVPGFIMAAVLEEVVMRGIVFRILEQWLGSWIALAISAALFGLLHLLNPGVTLLNSGAIMLEAGILFAAAYMLTRRLWFCVGIHFAWNFTQGGIFSAAVSGGATDGLLQSQLVGPGWLTGGAFGAEASVVALIVCVSAGLLLLLAARRLGHVIPSPWSRAAAALLLRGSGSHA
jgi:membrane protease YdiL (CAAX protease family)